MREFEMIYLDEVSAMAVLIYRYLRVHIPPPQCTRVFNWGAIFNYEDEVFDLDKMSIPGSIKKKICMRGSCAHYKYNGDCKYYRYVKHYSKNYGIDFQVTNHNLYLTSEKLSIFDRADLLKQSDFIIVDEAHKLKDAAVDVYGEKFGEKDIPKYLNMIKTSCADENGHAEYNNGVSPLNSFSLTAVDSACFQSNE